MAIDLKIAAVSYLNTVPFIYGIQHEGSLSAELLLSPPAQCVEEFEQGNVDVALIPVAELPRLKDVEIISGFCLGAGEEVRSVVLLSDDPIESIKRIFVDPHSKSSVQLAGYLAKHHWGIDPEWIYISDYDQVNHPEDGDAFVLIGDKVFDHEGEFEYTLDLASEWYEATELPFVFAVWVARKGVDNEIVDALEDSLCYGVEHIFEAIKELRGDADLVESYTYLTENMDFLFDEQKRKALKKFWDAGIKIEPKSNPG